MKEHAMNNVTIEELKDLHQRIGKLIKDHDTESPRSKIMSLAGRYIASRGEGRASGYALVEHIRTVKIEANDEITFHIERVHFDFRIESGGTEIVADTCATDVTWYFNEALALAEGRNSSYKIVTEYEFKQVASIAESLKQDLFNAIAAITKA
jgi:hypothetical protein